MSSTRRLTHALETELREEIERLEACQERAYDYGSRMSKRAAKAQVRADKLESDLKKAVVALEFYADSSKYGHEGMTPSCPDWYLGEIEELDRGAKAAATLTLICVDLNQG